jgi:hypothetical protein
VIAAPHRVRTASYGILGFSQNRVYRLNDAIDWGASRLLGPNIGAHGISESRAIFSGRVGPLGENLVQLGEQFLIFLFRSV